MNSDSSLPAGFETLEVFVRDWVLADAAARMARRQSSTIEIIRHFYQAILPQGERALKYLQGFELGALSPEGERLLKLMLSLAEVAPAVEWYDNPQVYDGFPIGRISYLRQIPDTAAQR